MNRMWFVFMGLWTGLYLPRGSWLSAVAALLLVGSLGLAWWSDRHVPEKRRPVNRF